MPSRSPPPPTKQERDLDRFKAWSNDNGILLANGLELVSSSSSGDDDDDDWSLVLTKSFEKAAPQCLVTIPNELILSSPKIQNEWQDNVGVQKAIEYLHDNNIGEQIPQFFLWLRLLEEYDKGAASKWYGWIQYGLPQKFDTTAVCLDEAEMDCLPPFALFHAKMIRYHYQVFLQALDEMRMVQKEKEDGGDCIIISKETSKDLELLRWAFNVVFTRCWGKADFDLDLDDDDSHSQQPPEDESTNIKRHDLVPMGDMFNHGEPANVFVDYDDSNDDCSIVMKDNATIMNTSTDPSSSSNTTTSSSTLTSPLLKLSYGRSTMPSHFLCLFGFVDISQRKIFCQMLVTKPTPQHVEMGYDTTKMVFDTLDGAIAEEVFDVTLFSILEQLPVIQKQFYQAHIHDDQKTKAILRHQYYLETCIMIKKHVDSTLLILEELLQKITTLQQQQQQQQVSNDDKDKKDEDHHHHDDVVYNNPRRLETIYQHNIFFHQTFWKVQQRINKMIRQEMESRRQSSPS